MAINVTTVRTEAANAVLDALKAVYEDADIESMKGFAEAVLVAVLNVIDQAEVEVSGESVR